MGVGGWEGGRGSGRVEEREGGCEPGESSEGVRVSGGGGRTGGCVSVEGGDEGGGKPAANVGGGGGGGRGRVRQGKRHATISRCSAMQCR